MDDEEATWASARSGDAVAFGALFDNHRDRVFGQALRLMRMSHDAEDVTALVFLEAWRRRNHVRVVDGSIIAWLLVTTNFVARNQTRTLHRHRLAMATLPPAEPTRDFSADVDARLDGDERAVAAREAFAALSQKDQDVVTLCVIEEFSIAQASAALGIPSGTVKSRLSRAKQKLATALIELSHSTVAPGGAR